MKRFHFITPVLFFFITATAQKVKTFDVKSLDGTTVLHVTVADKTQWTVEHDGQQIIAPSALSLQLQNMVLGDKAIVTSSKTEKVNNVIPAVNYIKDTIADTYNQLTLNCKGDYGIIFRVYNDAVAYRFFTKKKDSIIVQNEEAAFNFAGDYKAFIPIEFDYRNGQNFNSSFEALYHEINLSQFPKDSLAFLPLMVDVGNGKKVVILESDLEDYPGMYLNLNETGKGLKGVYAPYPLHAQVVGINYIPNERAGYIAATARHAQLSWRVVAIANEDKDFLNNDIVQKLASPARLTDYSWVKPGQVAWDWWNNWNITGVDFKAGINVETYKYYIDFAAENKLPYIVMDEGWSNDLDLLQVKPNFDLQAIIDYGKQKGVGVILWATWYAVSHQMDTVFPHYAQMGVKGFKIDFFDRDDAIAVASTYAIAKKAAAYKLMVDYHGIYKPTGLNRTYPNVMGYEGVRGLENFKWAPNDDQPRYVTSLPFIRMLAGPMDYTPGAMRNATKTGYRPIGENPMSQGTRCQQLAEYIVFYAPLQMLSDNPTTYKKEQECTDFITAVPTTWDQTVPLDSKISEYVAVARRKGDTWFVGAMGNWNAHDITIDFSFLPAGDYTAVVFRDGINADRNATDYKKETVTVNAGDKRTVHLALGGGWVARIVKQ